MQTRLSGGRSLGIPIRELGRTAVLEADNYRQTVKAELEEYYAARSACKRTANNELDAQPRTRDDAQGIAAGVETATARYRPEMVRKASDIRVSTPCTSAGEMEWVRARQLMHDQMTKRSGEFADSKDRLARSATLDHAAEPLEAVCKWRVCRVCWPILNDLDSHSLLPPTSDSQNIRSRDAAAHRRHSPVAH